MLNPTLAQALAIAHIEDLHRAAARRHMIRLARRVAHEPRGRGHANRKTAIRTDSTRWTPRAPGRRHDAKRDSASSLMAVPSRRRRMT